MNITRSHIVPAPAAAAWAVLADYRRDREWRTGVEVMEPSPAGPAQPGTTTHEVMRLGGKTYVNEGVVDAVDAGHLLTWHTVEGADASGSRQVVDRPDGTSEVTLTLNVRPHGGEVLIAPIVRRMLDRNLRRDLAALSALVADVRTSSASADSADSAAA